MLDIRKTILSIVALAVSTAVSAKPESAQAGAVDWPVLNGTTIWTEQAQPGWVPGFGAVLDFEAGGTGVSYETLTPFAELGDPATIPEPFTWTATGSTLEIVYDDFSSVSFPGVSYPYDVFSVAYGFDQAVVDFLNLAFENGQIVEPFFQVQLTSRTVSSSRVLNDEQNDRGGVSSTVVTENSIDELLTSLNWPGALPRGVVTTEAEQLVYLPGAITNGLPTPPAQGERWAVPHVYEPLDPRVTETAPPGWYVDLFTLEAAGQSSDGVLSQRGFTWSVSADGLVFESGNERYTHTPIETDGSNYFALTTYSVDGEVQLRGAGWIATDDGTGATLAPDLVQPIPEYWQAGINAWRAQVYRPNGQLMPSQVFGYSLADDATSFRLFAGTDNCLNDEFDPCFVREDPVFAWTWSAAGDTIVRDLQIPDFQIERTRTWTVLRYLPGGRATVFERAIWKFGDGPFTFVIRPRLNTLALTDLSSWPEEWANAEGFYAADDTDGDGIADAADNCLELAANDLRDTDGDGIGNVCDTDLNQDCQVNVEDLGLLRKAYDNWNPSADFTGDNVVNVSDLGIMRTQFFAAPGPSGVPNLCD